MVAILTKYIAPTNTRGARIKAYTANGRQSVSVTIGYPYLPGGDDASHKQAARALMSKMGWDFEIVQGGTDTGRAFVMLPKNLTVVNKAKS